MSSARNDTTTLIDVIAAAVRNGGDLTAIGRLVAHADKHGWDDADLVARITEGTTLWVCSCECTTAVGWWNVVREITARLIPNPEAVYNAAAALDDYNVPLDVAATALFGPLVLADRVALHDASHRETEADAADIDDIDAWHAAVTAVREADQQLPRRVTRPAPDDCTRITFDGHGGWTAA